MKPTGRPSVKASNARSIVHKVGGYMLYGCNVEYACSLAEISKSYFYQILKQHPRLEDTIHRIHTDYRFKKLRVHNRLFNAIVEKIEEGNQLNADEYSFFKFSLLKDRKMRGFFK